MAHLQLAVMGYHEREFKCYQNDAKKPVVEDFYEKKNDRKKEELQRIFRRLRRRSNWRCERTK